MHWLSASNAAKQVTSLVVVISRSDAAAGLKHNSRPLEIILLQLFPFASCRSVSSIFSGNFNLLIRIQQPNGFCSPSVHVKEALQPHQKDKAKLLCISYDTDAKTEASFFPEESSNDGTEGHCIFVLYYYQ